MLHCPSDVRGHWFEDDAMMNRRRLLSNLFSLAGLAVLLSACKHSPPPGSNNTPERNSDDRGDGGY